MGIFDFLFGNKDNKDSFKPFVFRSDSHQRYQNGSPVMGLQECIRTVRVEKNTNGCPAISTAIVRSNEVLIIDVLLKY